MEESLSKQLSNVVLPDTEEREIRLGSLWERKPAVIFVGAVAGKRLTYERLTKQDSLYTLLVVA